jgi:hypothetical protein
VIRAVSSLTALEAACDLPSDAVAASAGDEVFIGGGGRATGEYREGDILDEVETLAIP